MTCLANAIELRNITKRFGQVVANKSISLELHKGEILSLLGENGSGKTTLMNMLSGIYFPDEGQIYIHGEPVTIGSPKDAFAHGIGMIHQHFKLVDLFTATENIILGLEGKLDLNNARQKVKDICDKYGFDIDPDMKIYDMSVSQKQTVEIVKVLYRGADILILDEPTAVLTPQETEKLFTVMRNMKKDGKAIIIITHKLHEVLAVSDRVAVLRKGEYIGDTDTATASQQSLTDMMVGHTVSLNISRPEPKDVEKRLVIEGLTAYDELGVKRLDDVSFTVNAGEIVTLIGANGAGKSTTLKTISGLLKPRTGDVLYKGKSIKGVRAHKIVESGLAQVPEGRHVFLHMTVDENLDMGAYTQPASTIAANKEKVFTLFPRLKERRKQLAGTMSGGEQQMLAMGRALMSNASMLMLDEPSMGLSPLLVQEIFDIIRDIHKEGMTILLVEQNAQMALSVADRAYVLETGRVVMDGTGAELLTNERVRNAYLGG